MSAVYFDNGFKFVKTNNKMIRVPCQPNGDFVEVRQDALPTDVEKLTRMLTKEKAPIEYWLEIAVSLHLLTAH